MKENSKFFKVLKIVSERIDKVRLQLRDWYQKFKSDRRKTEDLATVWREPLVDNAHARELIESVSKHLTRRSPDPAYSEDLIRLCQYFKKQNTALGKALWMGSIRASLSSIIPGFRVRSIRAANQQEPVLKPVNHKKLSPHEFGTFLWDNRIALTSSNESLRSRVYQEVHMQDLTDVNDSCADEPLLPDEILLRLYTCIEDAVIPRSQVRWLGIAAILTICAAVTVFSIPWPGIANRNDLDGVASFMPATVALTLAIGAISARVQNLLINQLNHYSLATSKTWVAGSTATLAILTLLLGVGLNDDTPGVPAGIITLALFVLAAMGTVAAQHSVNIAEARLDELDKQQPANDSYDSKSNQTN
jgi:hypothetical protein